MRLQAKKIFIKRSKNINPLKIEKERALIAETPKMSIRQVVETRRRYIQEFDVLQFITMQIVLLFYSKI